MKWLVLSLGVALSACSAPVDPEAAREAAYRQALAAATAEARAHLAYFWVHEQAPAESEYDFRLKVALPRGDGHPGRVEAWVDSAARDGDRLSGQLAADTPELPGVGRGEVVTFAEADILDWAFFSNERLYGHYTTRVMLPKLPPEQADAMRSMFGDNPE